MRAVYVYAVSLLLCMAVVLPAFDDPHEDAFPLSTYPMFGGKKPRVLLRRVVGLDKEGDEVTLTPTLIAGTSEPIQTLVTIVQAIESGPKGLRQFCRTVAERVAQDPRFSAVASIAVESELRDAVAHYEGGHDKLQRTASDRTSSETTRHIRCAPSALRHARGSR